MSTTTYWLTLADARAYQASVAAPVLIRCLSGDAYDGLWSVDLLA